MRLWMIAIRSLGVVVMIATADALRLAGDVQDWIPAVQARLNGATTGFAQGQVTFSGYIEDLPTGQ